jgi:hypothetical protein
MIDALIARATLKWGKNILGFLSELYSGQWLPSHDIAHHKRVWENASGLCRLTNRKFWIDDPSFFDKLMLCCYFHDVGMLTDKSDRHGKESRKTCEKFLAGYNQLVQFDVEELLSAIENHDEKTNYNKIIKPGKLLQILTVADDLDAFGALGAYRYIEIYLLRGIPPELIAEKILSNAHQRYENIKSILAGYDVPMGQYYNKFQILKSLLETNNNFESPEVLINWVNEYVVEPKKNPAVTFAELKNRNFQHNRIANFIEKFLIEAHNN